MSLPPCDGTYAALPYRDAPYLASLDEIETHFVEGAPEPTRRRRALIMRALRLHVDVVTRIADKHGTAVTILLNGGFVSWKPKAPRDADLVVLVPPAVYPLFVQPPMLPLWTLSDVSATLGQRGGDVHVDVLRPGFGLADCYVNPDLPANRRNWHETWSAARDLNTDDVVEGPHKGYIEIEVVDDHG